MRPDELGAALVLALEENLTLKQRQERDKRLLERRIEEARQQLEEALAEYRGAVDGLEGRVNELGEVASRKLAEARRELAERVEEVAAQKPVEVTHTVERVERVEAVSDGSGVENFSRPDDKDELVLERKDGTKFRVKLPKRVVQHIDQGGGGGGISETRVLQLIQENSGGGGDVLLTYTAPEQKTVGSVADNLVAAGAATTLRRITVWVPNGADIGIYCNPAGTATSAHFLIPPGGHGIWDTNQALSAIRAGSADVTAYVQVGTA